MKKVITCIFLIMILMLSACTHNDNNIKDVKANEPTKEPTKQEVAKSAFEILGKDAPEDGLILLVNNPNKDKTALVNISKSIELNKTDEHVLIIPKNENTSIQIWSLKYANDKLVRNELVYDNRRTGNDFVLDAEITRPEGMPQYKMLIYTPDSYAEYIFTYDGKDGNAETEYISAVKPKNSDRFSFHEMGYIFTNKVEDIISLYGEPSEKRTIPFMGNDTATELIYGGNNFKISNLGDKGGLLYSAIAADNKISHPRGVKIGDDLQSVINKFPNSGNTKKIKFEDSLDRTYSLLYGKYYHMQDFGMIEYIGDTPVCITYSTESSNVVFELENGKVSKVRYEVPLT